MSQQHAEALVADLYDYSDGILETAASAYARYMEFKLGRVADPKRRKYALTPERKAELRAKVDAELAR